MEKQYLYKATVVGVTDGDTITVDVCLGFHITIREIVRLYGIDTPEIRGVERVSGLQVKEYVRECLLGKEIVLETFKDKKGKYGRYLGKIFLQDAVTGVSECFNDRLVTLGYAEPYLP